MVQRRLRRKRRSGHGRYGNEVTSGFDRHRMVSSDSSSESDQSEDEKEPKKKSKQSEESRKWSWSFSSNVTSNVFMPIIGVLHYYSCKWVEFKLTTFVKCVFSRVGKVSKSEWRSEASNGGKRAAERNDDRRNAIVCEALLSNKLEIVRVIFTQKYRKLGSWDHFAKFKGITFLMSVFNDFLELERKLYPRLEVNCVNLREEKGFEG